MPPPDQALLDELSEMLALERDGERLYAQPLTTPPPTCTPRRSSTPSGAGGTAW